MKWRQLWWAILACYIVGQLVSIPVAVLWAVSITRADRDQHITQTVTVEQPDTLTDIIHREREANGMRSRMGSVPTGNQRPDSGGDPP